jgi:hypothetical protein
MLISFSIINTIYGSTKIVHISNVSIHIQIRCVLELFTLNLFIKNELNNKFETKNQL